MGWLGKALGGTVGFALAGVWGALGGAVLGHKVDSQARRDTVSCPRCRRGLKVPRFGTWQCPYCKVKFAYGPPASRPDRLDRCYAVLGCNPTDSMAVIKQRYRRKVALLHPDKLAAKDLPEELLRHALERVQELNEAYHRVSSQRASSPK